MATLTLASRGSGTPIATAAGSTWVALTNAVDGSPGTNPDTFAQVSWSNPSSVAYIIISGYDFSAIRDIDTLNSVTITFRHRESHTSNIASVTVQATGAVGLILTATAVTRSTTTIDSSITFSPTLADLKSGTFQVRATATRANNITSATWYIDHIDVVATYTSAINQGSATTTWAAAATATGSAPVLGRGSAVVNTLWAPSASGPSSPRVYGQLTYGDGTYGGPVPVWDPLQGPMGPPGDPDLALRRPVSVPITFQAGWSNFPGFVNATVYRDYQGVCSLNATLAGPSSFAGGSVPFYLPLGFRPLNRVMHLGYVGNPDTGVRIDLQQDGAVVYSSGAVTGASYMILDSIWAVPMPVSYVIEGCAPLRMTRLGGNSYTMTVTPGFYLQASVGLGVVSTNLTTTFNGNATVGSWNMVCVVQGALTCISQDSGGGAFTTEAAALGTYYNSCGQGGLYADSALVATFQSTGAGVVPTFYDRRHLPWMTTYPTHTP